MSETASFAPSSVTNKRFALLAIGVVCYAITLGAGIWTPGLRQQYMSAYLWSWLLWCGPGFGGLAMSCIHHLSGGRWGFAMRRPLEAASLTIPVMGLLSIPLLFNFNALYPWAPANRSLPLFANDEALVHQIEVWWHPTWIVLEVLAAFLILTIFAYGLRRMSVRYGESGDPRIVGPMKAASAGGMIFVFICVSVIVLDLVMGREAHYYSTMFEVKVIVGSALSSWALTLAMMPLLRKNPEVARLTPPDMMNDLGALMFAMTVLWAYVSFFELLIIWMGNLAGESVWFVRRGIGGTYHNGWTFVAVLLLSVHFFLPFILLLQRPIKRVPERVQKVAILLICMRALDLMWLSKPTSLDDLINPQPGTVGIRLSWFDFIVPIGIGGIFFFCYLSALAARPIIVRSEQEDVLRAKLAAMGATPVHA